MFDNAHQLPNATLFCHIRNWQSAKNIDARNAAVQANLRLVKRIAGSFLNRGLDFDDVVSHGCLGLMRAIDLFDCDRGLQFSTYASYWIKQNIKRAITNESRTIRVPAHQQELEAKIGKFVRTFVSEHGHKPPIEAVAAGIAKRPKKIATFLRSCRGSPRTFSGDVITDDMPTPQRSALLDAEELVLAKEMLLRERALRAAYPKALAELDISSRDRKIFERFLGLNGYPAGRNLKEVGADAGLTRERARQIVNEAACKLSLIHPAWRDYEWYLTQPALIETLDRVVG